MIRTKGEAGSGNIVEAVRHLRNIINDIKHISTLGHDQLMATARDMKTPFSLLELCIMDPISHQEKLYGL